MKVLMITMWGRKRSGITVHVENIIKNTGAEFTIATYKKPGQERKTKIGGKEVEIIGIPFIDFPVLRALSFVFFGFFYFFFNSKIKENISIMHAHYGVPQGLLGALVKKITNLKLVVTFHGSDALVLGRNFFLKHAVKFAARNADEIIAVSDYVKEALVSLGVSGGRIKVIPNGVEKEFKEPAGEAKRVVFIGALVEQKNVDVLLKAYKKVKEEISDAELFIAGEGTERIKLEKLAEKLGLKDVCFAGYLDNVDEAFTKNSCLVLPSKEEGFGIVLLEAMIRGVPVIASRIKSIEEIVKHEYNGLLFNDESGLAEQIKRVFKDAELRKILKKNGEEHAKKFDWRSTAKHVEEIYRKLAKNSL